MLPAASPASSMPEGRDVAETAIALQRLLDGIRCLGAEPSHHRSGGEAHGTIAGGLLAQDLAHHGAHIGDVVQLAQMMLQALQLFQIPLHVLAGIERGKDSLLYSSDAQDEMQCVD